jgi:hypothetical protein
MRPKMFSINTAATGQTPWHFLDYRANPFSVSVMCDTNGGTGSYVVEHGFSDMIRRNIVINRSTTTATIDIADHKLGPSDNIIISGSGTTFDGTWLVASVVNANQITVTVPNSGDTYATGFAIPVHVFPHSVLGSAQTTAKDGNYAFPVQCVRMRITVTGAGSYTFLVNQGSN